MDKLTDETDAMKAAEHRADCNDKGIQQDFADTGLEGTVLNGRPDAVAAGMHSAADDEPAITGEDVQQAGYVDQQAASEGDEANPKIFGSSSSTPIVDEDVERTVNWTLDEDAPLSDISALRNFALALADSAKGYEAAARNGEELLRPIFLQRAKERQEMVNELNARIMAMGGVIEGEYDVIPGFASAINHALEGDRHLLGRVEEHEAGLRSIFLTAFNNQSDEIVAFLKARYMVIERSEQELRKLRSEMNAAD